MDNSYLINIKLFPFKKVLVEQVLLIPAKLINFESDQFVLLTDTLPHRQQTR